MKIITLLIAFALATPGIRAAAEPVNVATFLKARGAEDAGLRLMARSPNPAIVPVSLYDKDNSVPSCGVLIAPPR